MADDPSQQNSPSTADDDAETKFWAKFDERVGQLLDARLPKQEPKAPDKKEPAQSPPQSDPKPQEPQGTTRMSSKRVTLPGLIADVVFGPQKD